MKIIKWIIYVILGVVLNCGVNSALLKLLKLDKEDEKKEALDAELY